MSDKKYGLVLPELKFQASRNVFGDDSDSDKETSKKSILLRPSDNVNRQAKIAQEKAVTEDPTVYQYDEIYDDIVSSKQKEKIKNKEDAKPRYIENLIKSANKRKLENERRIERQIQKEREKEGEEFKDKEVFVTSAYKKKLQEMHEEEEREKREEYLESIGDVTKQKDLGGFYRHLYEQQLGSNKTSDGDKPVSDESNKPVSDERNKPVCDESNKPVCDESNKPVSDESNKPICDGSNKEESSSEVKTETTEDPKPEPIKRRNYRKRKSTETKTQLSEGEIEDSDEEINRLNLDNIKLAKKSKTQENIDADSDFSIDESSDEEPEKTDENQTLELQKESNTTNKVDTPETEVKTETDSKKDTVPDVVVEVKPKIDIWKKRTVGEVFDEALKRYYERKAARGS